MPIPPTFLQITQLKGIVLLTLDVLVFAMACTVTFVYIKNGSNLDMYINQSYALDVDSAAPRHTAYECAKTRKISIFSTVLVTLDMIMQFQLTFISY